MFPSSFLVLKQICLKKLWHRKKQPLVCMYSFVSVFVCTYTLNMIFMLISGILEGCVHLLMDCMISNTFSSIVLVKLLQPVYLFILSLSFCYQSYAEFFLKLPAPSPHNHQRKNDWLFERKETCCNDIHAIRPGLSGTVPDFNILSWHPRKYEIVLAISKIKSTNFLRPIEGEGFVINSCLNGKCCIYCRVPIIGDN